MLLGILLQVFLFSKVSICEGAWDPGMRGYKLLEREAEEVVACVKYRTEEEVVRRLIVHQADARDICTTIVTDGSTALHALAQMPRPHILQVGVLDFTSFEDLITAYHSSQST